VRILVVDTLYERFLAEHYAGRPHLAEAAYDAQLRALMDRSFGTSDAYSHYLTELGHDAIDVVVNCDELQLAWAREHRGPALLSLRRRLGRDWRLAILIAQVESFRPDAVYIQDVAFFTPAALSELKRRARLLVGQLGTSAPGRERLRQFDLILTSFPHFVPRLRQLDIDTELFRIGFDPRVLERLGPNTEPPIDVAFVGALSGESWRRSDQLLERAVTTTSIEFWGYGIEGLPAHSPIRARYRGEAWGLDMYRIFRRSRIVLNRHGDVAESFSNNMRLYEATGVGALLVTEAGENLAELFEPEREVVSYVDADDALERIGHLLNDEARRDAIARAGQARTLRDHTYAVRMAELAGILETRLS
jgi:spore maturation protein CgeB